MEAAGERRNSRQIAAPHGEDVLAARQCAVMCSAAACYGHTAPTFWGVIGLMWMSLGLDALWDRLKNLLPVKPAPVTLRVAVELARRITRYAAAKLKKIHEFARLNIQTIHENILPAIGDVLRAIGIVRAPLIVAIFGAAILSLPDQTTELYRVMALDYEARHFQVWGSFTTCFAAAFAFSAFGRALVASNLFRLRTAWGKAVITVMPTLCGVLLPLGALLGLYRGNVTPVAVGPYAEGTPEFQTYVHSIAMSLPRMRAAMLICLLITAVCVVLNLRRIPRREVSPSSRWSALGLYTACVFILGTGILITLFASGNAAFAEFLGAVTIVMLFFICLAFFSSVLSLFYYQYRIPATTCLVLLAVIFSAANLNDNHVVQIVSRDPIELGSAVRSFSAWYDNRADKDRFLQRSEPYPVFLISAAGGGLYAAYYTSQVLARTPRSLSQFRPACLCYQRCIGWKPRVGRVQCVIKGHGNKCCDRVLHVRSP